MVILVVHELKTSDKLDQHVVNHLRRIKTMITVLESTAQHPDIHNSNINMK